MRFFSLPTGKHSLTFNKKLLRDLFNKKGLFSDYSVIVGVYSVRFFSFPTGKHSLTFNKKLLRDLFNKKAIIP
jgi:hypothetical protein